MVTRSVLTALGLLLILSACSTSKPVLSTEEYHEKTIPESDSESSREPPSKALNGLQRLAIKSMNKKDYVLSNSILQRAVKVDPRNPLNWHYLAQNYLNLQDFPNCIAMAQRAQSYMHYRPDLAEKNNTLLKQCSP